MERWVGPPRISAGNVFFDTVQPASPIAEEDTSLMLKTELGVPGQPVGTHLSPLIPPRQA
eukprot:SAG31_NODE_105_length_25008_cov_17.439399_17_plen_60_part_00